jgi:hypothetical protein
MARLYTCARQPTSGPRVRVKRGDSAVNCTARAIGVAASAALAIVHPADAKCPPFQPHAAPSNSGSELLSETWIFGHYTGQDSVASHLSKLIGYLHHGSGNHRSKFMGLWHCDYGSYQLFFLPHDFEPTLFVSGGDPAGGSTSCITFAHSVPISP